MSLLNSWGSLRKQKKTEGFPARRASLCFRPLKQNENIRHGKDGACEINNTDGTLRDETNPKRQTCHAEDRQDPEDRSREIGQHTPGRRRRRRRRPIRPRSWSQRCPRQRSKKQRTSIYPRSPPRCPIYMVILASRVGSLVFLNYYN